MDRLIRIFLPNEEAVFEHTANWHSGPLLAKQRRRQLAEEKGALSSETKIENRNAKSDSDRTLTEEEVVMRQADKKSSSL